MSGDGNGYEYPDEAGYPDGMGTLHEGTDEVAEADGDEAALDHFAMEDEEDDDEGV